MIVRWSSGNMTGLKAVGVVIVLNREGIARAIIPARMAQTAGADAHDDSHKQRQRTRAHAPHRSQRVHQLSDSTPVAIRLSKQWECDVS